MRKSFLYASLLAGASLAGCGGQSNSSGGYDNSLGGSGRGFNNSAGTAPTVPNSAIWPSEGGKPLILQGVNVPSFSGEAGSEFGKNPLSPEGAVRYKPDLVENAFKDIHAIGFNAVRLTLFQGGDGLKLDKEGRVTGLEDTFRKNLEDAVEKAKTGKIKLYLSLDAPWGHAKVKSPLTDKKALDGFVKNAVAPLVRKYKGNDSIFAFDIARGIEGDVAGAEGNGSEKGATWEQARVFVRSTVEFVKQNDPQRLVSVSYKTNGIANLKKGSLKGLGLDFYDIGIFDDAGALPPVKDLSADRPVILGAFGQSAADRSDDLQAKAAAAFVQNTFDQGYAGYFISNYAAKGADDKHSLHGADGKHRPVVDSLKRVMEQNKR